MSDNARLLIDADEAAELLGISRRQLYALARERALPYVRVGRYLRFRLSAVGGRA
ncbi:MAG: helix-turn-helix domain-containing protein [Solirubrobacteraceae bacterium]